MKQRLPEDDKPWYRQFWPWFIIALPATVVIAGFTTLFIALKNPHSMVDDQYYREGLAINRRLEMDRQASELGMQARVFFDREQSRVTVVLSGRDQPQQMRLMLLHPGKERFDQALELQSMGAGNYVGNLTGQYQLSYYLRLLPQDNSWRLNGEVDFNFGDRVLLVSE